SAGQLSYTNAFAAEKRLIGSVELGVKPARAIELRARVAHNRAEPKVRDLQEIRALASLGPAHVLTLAFENLRDRDDETSLSESSFGSFPGALNEKRTN